MVIIHSYFFLFLHFFFLSHYLEENDAGKTRHIAPISENLGKIRKKILLDQRTKEIFVEIVLYFSFVILVLLVVLGHSDVKQAFSVTKSIEDIYVHTYLDKNVQYFYKVIQYVPTYIHICMHTYMPTPIHSCMHDCMYAHTYVCVIVCLNVCVCVCVSCRG